MTRTLLIALVLLIALPRSSHAQQGSSDSASRAAAEALFEQGRQLIKEENYAEACSKLEASHKLDPGVGTLLYLGDCYEKAGKLAGSWAAFQEASSLGRARGEMDRVKVAEVRAAAIKPRIPMVVFVVDQPVPGLEVRRDGALIPQASWGSPLPVDAGESVVVVSAPGYRRWEYRLSVPAVLKEPWPLMIPALAKEGAEAPLASDQAAQPAPATSPAAPVDDGSSQRTVGLLVGGVGAVALIASGILTVVAANKNASSEDNCLPAAPNQCNPAGVADRDDALNLANVATVAGIAGGVVLAGGAVLYFTAPRSEASAAPQGLLVNLKGQF
jgi:serine/threonine-protein kinase